MSGHFEVSKFKGTYVSVFDSHWFAEKIIATAGKEFMCAVIAKTIGLFLPRGLVPCMDAVRQFFHTAMKWRCIEKKILRSLNIL